MRTIFPGSLMLGTWTVRGGALSASLWLLYSSSSFSESDSLEELEEGDEELVEEEDDIANLQLKTFQTVKITRAENWPKILNWLAVTTAEAQKIR